MFRRVPEDQIRQYGRTEKAAREAIRICRDRGVLAEYLKDREKEVVNIMIMLFDQEYAVNQFGKAQKEEGRDENQVSNIRKMMKNLKMTAEAAMDILEIPSEEQKKYALMLKEGKVTDQYSAEE